MLMAGYRRFQGRHTIRVAHREPVLVEEHVLIAAVAVVFVRAAAVVDFAQAVSAMLARDSTLLVFAQTRIVKEQNIHLLVSQMRYTQVKRRAFPTFGPGMRQMKFRTDSPKSARGVNLDSLRFPLFISCERSFCNTPRYTRFALRVFRFTSHGILRPKIAHPMRAPL